MYEEEIPTRLRYISGTRAKLKRCMPMWRKNETVLLVLLMLLSSSIMVAALSAKNHVRSHNCFIVYKKPRWNSKNLIPVVVKRWSYYRIVIKFHRNKYGNQTLEHYECCLALVVCPWLNKVLSNRPFEICPIPVQILEMQRNSV